MGIEAGIGTAIATTAGLTTATGGLTAAGTALAIAVNLAISAGLSAGAAALSAPDQGPRKPSRTGNIKQPLSPHEVVYGSVRKGGVIFFVSGSHFANTRLHMCIALAAHECESIEAVYINGQLNELVAVVPSDGVPPYGEYHPELGDEYIMYVPDTGHARSRFSAFNWRLGTATQEAIPGMVMDCEEWTVDHRALGICYFYSRLVYDVTDDSKIWPSFIPAMTVRMKGRKDIYDPRDESTGWTDNPALIAANVLETLLNVPRERIDTDALIEAANICDETVPLKGGGTEKRYRCCGYFSLEGEPGDWLEPIIRAMAGTCIEHHGDYYIHAGTWREPEVTITDANIMGAIRVRTATSDRERANVARGIFASAESHDQPTEFPRIIHADGVTEDGLELEMDINLEFVPSSTQAQRVAKILLLTAREGRTVEVGLDLLTGLDVKPWDTVTLDLQTMGLSGLFRVIEHKTTIEGGDNPAVMPTLTLREVSESFYAWDEATEEQELALASPVIPGSDLEPDNLEYSVAVNSSNAAFFPGTVTATWEDPALIDFDAIEVQVIMHFQWRPNSLTAWSDEVIEANGEVAPGVGTLALQVIDEDFAGSSFEFQGHVIERVRVRTRVTSTSWSDWTEIEGDLRAPLGVSKTFTPYSSKTGHKIGAVKMVWNPPADITPAAYEVEAKVEYEWKQGANPYVAATYVENRARVKGKKINLVLWDKGKPGGSTQFQNHTLVYARVRSLNGDGTVSEWTNL
ncbi:phage tail protein [Luteolibacter luteus]|uniref:Tip attachment protein J domain-containing protein n=1 Tax=Luteolibacter luteus TaxID=2728835 RepID=A0A858RNI1_9BACT|nr:phage tail protein [Luteolibacter luteus]QJE97988.1 hypothetical protein HHL09_20080 [Luteolibacter luteus]